MSKPKTAGEAWAATVLETFDVPPAERETLRLAGAALDRADRAQAAIDRLGLMVDGLHGPKVNGAVAVKRDAVAEHARLCRALGLYTKDAK